MNIFGALAAAFLSLAPVSGRLEGTWIETTQVRETPRAVMHFKGRKLRFENMFDDSGTVKYKVTEKHGGEFCISFEHRHNVRRANGNIVERVEEPEFLYHVENGRPILSEKGFEYDGRGPIIMSEYLREEDFIDGFRSELKHRLNDRPTPSMMKE